LFSVVVLFARVVRRLSSSVRFEKKDLAGRDFFYFFFLKKKQNFLSTNKQESPHARVVLRNNILMFASARVQNGVVAKAVVGGQKVCVRERREKAFLFSLLRLVLDFSFYVIFCILSPLFLSSLGSSDVLLYVRSLFFR